MFIICPKCGAKYQIPEGTTLENGQKLKCSACGHLFTKGEESPLVLDKLASPEPETAAQAFSKPLYTMDDTPAKTDSPIPEVFQPIPESAPKKSGLWIIPIYMILLVLLCIAGWKFRDLLKPSFSDILPDTQNKPARTITLPQKHHIPAALPAIEKAPVPPVVQSPLEMPKAEPSPLPPPVQKEIEPQKPILPLAPTESIPQKPETKEPNSPSPTLTPSEPVIDPLPIPEPVRIKEPTPLPKEDLTPKANALPNSTIVENPVEPLPLPPESDSNTEIEDDSQPLFEIAKPAKADSTQIKDVVYKIEPNEAGVSQLLVNGNLHNLKTEIQSAPALTLFVYDAQGQLLTQKEIRLTTEMLAPSEIVPFYTSILPAPEGTARVEVR